MKSVLITGASSGIGKALAIHYADKGYQVFAGGRNIQRLNKLSEGYDNITPLVCDVTSKESIKEASLNLPPLDIVILNAGDCEYINDAKDFDGDLFARIITTNLISVGYCLQAWLKLIKSGGKLALTSSSAAFLPLPRAEAYGASKAGLSYLAKTLHIDLKAHNIHVSVIHPGFVDTPLTQKNTFVMPQIITAEKAAGYIASGLDNNKVEINFPRYFIWIMKFIRLLPFSLWQKIALRMSIDKEHYKEV